MNLLRIFGRTYKPETWRPKALDSLFETGLCPDCGHNKFHDTQDGGHDRLLECAKCHAKFGVQDPPFCIIERISK